MNELYLDNFVTPTSAEIAKISVKPSDNCYFIDTKNQTLPVKATPLVEESDLENEVEAETDLLPTIECTSFNFSNPECLFLNVYSAYSFTVIKVEFLDIFSPPPNC
ncbi:MAG TPA: hypothetical protein VK796_09915 [Cytophaga sp.]|nr:hypothetical protein [Cytophaga sp.]